MQERDYLRAFITFKLTARSLANRSIAHGYSTLEYADEKKRKVQSRTEMLAVAQLQPDEAPPHHCPRSVRVHEFQLITKPPSQHHPSTCM